MPVQCVTLCFLFSVPNLYKTCDSQRVKLNALFDCFFFSFDLLHFFTFYYILFLLYFCLCTVRKTKQSEPRPIRENETKQKKKKKKQTAK